MRSPSRHVASQSCTRRLYRPGLSTSSIHIRRQKRILSMDHSSQTEDLKKRVAKLRATHPHFGDVSEHRTADDIKRVLEADGHRICRFVVYRCTYDNDKNWQLCMKRIHEDVRQGIDTSNGRQGLLDEHCFKLTVIEDQSKFDGAGTSTIRQHFQDRSTYAIGEEQGTDDD
jgi:hypothetical protein